MLAKLASLRFASPGYTGPVVHDGRLDSLRGFAAWSVMVVHGFGYDGKDYASPLAATNEYVRQLHMSHAAVLLFFITSGYVIGLTNQASFSPGLAFSYLRKRSWRIVPLYLLAILAGWLAWRAVTAGNLLANVFFLQNSDWGIQPLAGNRPVWSLHFEVVYYLGFLLLWKFQPRVLPLLAIMLLLGAGGWFWEGTFSFLGGWAIGGLFWLAGLLLAWLRPATGSASILGFGLLLYATNHLWPGEILLRGLGHPKAIVSPLVLADLALLPGALVFFCAAVRLNFRGLIVAQWLAFLIPAGTCVLLLLMGRLWENVPWTMAGIATALSVPLLLVEREQWSEIFFRLFRPLGRISYGVYLLHYPCVALAVWLYPWGTSAFNYLGGILCWIALTVALAWLGEARLQPWLLAHFRKPPAPAPTAPGKN